MGVCVILERERDDIVDISRNDIADTRVCNSVAESSSIIVLHLELTVRNESVFFFLKKIEKIMFFGRCLKRVRVP